MRRDDPRGDDRRVAGPRAEERQFLAEGDTRV